MFRSLSYYQDYEDELIRGDQYEGTLKYTGSNGLKINNLTTGGSFKAPWSFVSQVDVENVFVFCVSNKLCPDLAREFKSDVCIEIVNPSNVISKLHGAVRLRKKIKPNKLFHGKVDYYRAEDAPGKKWAFPNEIAMRKLKIFSEQSEYRFSFSLNGALDFGKVSQEIRIGEKVKKHRLHPYPEHVLKIGDIRKWCKIHEFT